MTRTARLLVIENAVPPGPPGLVMAYLDLQMLAAWAGRERTVTEYRELLGAAGLRLAAVQLAEPRSGLTVLAAVRTGPDAPDDLQTGDQTQPGWPGSHAARR